jgi:hypothetical protein
MREEHRRRVLGERSTDHGGGKREEVAIKPPSTAAAHPHNRHTPAYSETDVFMRAGGFAEMSD